METLGIEIFGQRKKREATNQQIGSPICGQNKSFAKFHGATFLAKVHEN